MDELNQKTDKKPGLYIKTYGCQMNEYDTEKFYNLMSGTHRKVDTPEDAEIVILNTCSVREKAEHKLRSELGEISLLKRKRGDMIIGVGGCAAQQEGKKILKLNKGVDFVVGTHNLSLVPSMVEKVKRGEGPQVSVDYREEWEELPEEFDSFMSAETGMQTFSQYAQPTRALVAIQRGCSKNCSYCVVPTTRGAEVSRDPTEIERELRLKVRLGAKEVMLLGQTVNSYGKDLTPKIRFENLVERLSRIEGLERIRFTSPHPQDVRPEFIKLYSDIPSLCPHIHLPLQSGSDRVLKLMNRNYRMKRYYEIVDSLREAVPNIAITTDIIVGFPTETEEDFNLSLEAMRRVGYSSSYSFIYSKRPNTTAINDYAPEDHLPDSVAKERLYRLQDLQSELSYNYNCRYENQIVDVLIEGSENNLKSKLRGRTPENIWCEVLTGDVNIKSGQTVKAKVTSISKFGIRGILYESNSN